VKDDLLIVTALAALLATATVLADGARDPQDALIGEATRYFRPLDPAPSPATAQATLGRALFWDKRLSADGNTACASCHSATEGGADRRRASIDARGAPTTRHSQTVFNVVGQRTMRWLGDRADGVEQAESSITGSMGFVTRDALLPVLRSAGYEAAFRSAFPDDPEPIGTRNYGRAIEAYEATLATPAPFDRFLAGDASALDRRQKAGLRTFIDRGCVGCHDGALLGGGTFQRFGLFDDYWRVTGSSRVDSGRYAITKRDTDRYVFRVPMLRNVALTAPYFHDGSVPTLDAAVRAMAVLQLGRALGNDDVASIVAFLESLSGEVPAHYAPPRK
jgi:cytochrome c peroxidase